MTTEAHMAGLISKRYGAASKASIPHNVVAHQVPLHTHLGLKIIDSIAVEGHLSNDVRSAYREMVNVVGHPAPAVHGFEIKISRSDWLRELKTGGEKSVFWRAYCNYFWLVVPDASIVKPGELPEGWGLLVGTKRLREAAKATYSISEPIGQKLFTVIARYSQKKEQS